MYKVKNKKWCPNEKRENSKNEGTRIKRGEKKELKIRLKNVNRE